MKPQDNSCNLTGRMVVEPQLQAVNIQLVQSE